MLGALCSKVFNQTHERWKRDITNGHLLAITKPEQDEDVPPKNTNNGGYLTRKTTNNMCRSTHTHAHTECKRSPSELTLEKRPNNNMHINEEKKRLKWNNGQSNNVHNYEQYVFINYKNERRRLCARRLSLLRF